MIGGGVPSPYSAKGIPHNYNYGKTFLAHFNLCSQGVYQVLRFCSDLMKHFYPYAKIHDSLIGNDKTSNEGMMLANLTMLKIWICCKIRRMGNIYLDLMQQNELSSCMVNHCPLVYILLSRIRFYVRSRRLATRSTWRL